VTRTLIGVHVHAEPARLRATLAALAGNTSVPYELLLLGDGPDSETAEKLRALSEVRQSSTPEARGAPACFNRLVSHEADVVVLMESGSIPAPRWLEFLLEALRRPGVGLAGPSTNLSWNEQGVFAGARGEDLAATAAAARARFGDTVRSLEPLYSLSDFCLAVRREVLDAVGLADEEYGLGPCWEMDYNIRAARAGFRGVWVGASYVHRAPFTTRRQTEEARRFTRSRKLYQDRFCGGRLRGQKHDYRQHCRGDACPNFAPPSLIAVRLPFAEAPVVATPPPSPPPQARPAIEVGESPLVTCIMPTRDRRELVRASIRLFQRQDYANRELVIVDDGDDRVEDLVPADDRFRYIALPSPRTLGAKRNLANSKARGTLVAHWDDDDWYPSNRLSVQIAAMGDADLCGSSRLYFRDEAARKGWEYRYSGPGPWVAGTTFLYRRDFWSRNEFADRTIGEDADFFWRTKSRKVVDLADPKLCVATIHPHNTFARDVTGAYWHPRPFADVLEVMEAGETAPQPLVSCIMPTFNRRRFVPMALAWFAAQDWPNRELIVVDDGDDPVKDLTAGQPNVRYFHMGRRASIGAKRNFACARAGGSIIAHWDDDDWYAPQRLRQQLEPIVAGEADVTGLVSSFILDLHRRAFWTMRNDLHRSAFVGDVHGGTLVFRRSLFDSGLNYPDSNLAEDAALLLAARSRGFTLARLANHGTFVYVRHGRNAWREFQPGTFGRPASWERTQAPPAFDAATMEAYLQATQS
jgi:glycosyltransferase involved in cell wall biosynthesis